MGVPWEIIVLLVGSGVLLATSGWLLYLLISKGDSAPQSAPVVNVRLNVESGGASAPDPSVEVDEGFESAEDGDWQESFVGGKDEVDIGGRVGQRAGASGAEDAVDALSDLDLT
jgi:hypothetical protein